MRSVTVRLEDLRTTILNLGFVGENEHRQIRIDSKKFYDEYPQAAASLTVSPPCGEPYPAVIERDGDFVIWTITDSDVINEGDGEIQLSFTQDPHVGKTYIGRTRTGRSLVPTGDIQEGIDDFLTRAGAALTAIPETIGREIDEAMAENLETMEGLKSAAQEAKEGAEDAQTGAEAAQRAAESAQADAETASGAAEAAQTAAESAQTGAESAKADAESAAQSAGASAQSAEASSQLAAGSASAAGTSASNASGYAAAAAASAQSAAAQVQLVEAAGTAQIALVAAEGTAQAAAVEAKGEEVLESIPSDYSTLSGEVSQLKNHIKSSLIPKHLQGFTDGKYVNGYIDANGNIFNSGNTNWRTTDYIPVEEGNTVTYSLIGYESSVWIITAYDSSKQRIAADSVVGSSSLQYGIYTVASGTAFIRISGNKNSRGFYSGNIYDGYDNVDENINNAIGLTNYSVFPGYIASDGTYSDASATSKEIITTIIPVTPDVTEFSIDCEFSSSVAQWFAMANYSQSLGFLSREVIINETAKSKFVEKKITNSSVSFVAFSWRTYNEDAVTIRVKPNKIGGAGSGGSVEIDDTAGSGDTDKVWSANKTLTEVNNAKADVNLLVLPENDGYIASDGSINAPSSSSNEVYTDSLMVESGDVVDITLSYPSAKGMWLAYALYDANGGFLSRSVPIDSTLQTGNCSVTIPNTAKYIRITYRRYDSYTIRVSSTGKARLVTDMIVHSSNELIESAKYPFVLGEVINAASVSSDDSWNIDYATRCSTIVLQYTDVDLPISIADGYNVAYHTRSKDGTLISDSGWKSVKVTIPANTYYTLTVRKSNNGNITPQEVIENIFPGVMKDNELCTTYSKIAQRIIKDEIFSLSKHANVKAVNHRGYNTIAPENTIPAYKLSREKGFCYVECDVEYTSDDVPVLLHDTTINRTARNADGTSVSSTVDIREITYEQALTYDFGIFKGNEYAGTKIPTLEQFIVLCRNIGLHPYIELKEAGSTQSLIESCADIVRSAGMADKVTWISFSEVCLGYIKNVEPNARLGLLANQITSTIISNAEALKTSSNDVYIGAGSYTSSEIALCKDAGIHLEVWTINNTTTIKNLDPYISGVTSDNVNASYLLYGSNIL